MNKILGMLNDNRELWRWNNLGGRGGIILDWEGGCQKRSHWKGDTWIRTQESERISHAGLLRILAFNLNKVTWP